MDKIDRLGGKAAIVLFMAAGALYLIAFAVKLAGYDDADKLRDLPSDLATIGIGFAIGSGAIARWWNS